ncbi:MAG: DUF1501 domain-containing protein [Chthoniobacter sp.]|uniref:DUF1501 domain-containing protein n=1 Tax=Chthoniobacter sp. TaxID=2510640 RepID=UPI0032A81C9C
MFTPLHSPNAPVGGLRRREWLRIGGLGALGISLQGLGAGRASAAQAAGDKGASFGRAKSCIVFFLSGGPPQHDTFDPKPDAPLEIRGTFRPIATNVPGLNFCETLPHTARVADRLAVIRSMTTDINAHSTSGAFMLTGYVPPSKAENVPAGPQDWPSIASVVGTLKPSVRSPLSSVVLPELIHNNGNIVWPGQNGGFMGPAWHPMMIQCDPTQQPMRIEGMSLTDGVTSVRLAERFDLLQQFDAHFRDNAQSEAMATLDHMHHKAFDVLHSDASRRAFEIERESPALRDNYGRHKLGQSVLLARRLVEAGVRLVQVNWPRESGDENIGNPLWDTHQNNAGRVRDVLCPQFDRTFATLIADLESRGLLDETLVVVMGEFGRSPKINAAGGRDHWGSCFSVVLAGAGIGGGQIVGASDHLGAFPASRPVSPPDLAATIFHLLGLDPAGEFIDPLGRPRRLTDNGQPLRELIGI